jgi:DNA-binding response OmpR family regulator
MNMRILLIEDEPRLARTLSDRLKAENYRVESAFDGDTGLQKASNDKWLFGNCREMPQDIVVINQQSSVRASQCKFSSSNC